MHRAQYFGVLLLLVSMGLGPVGLAEEIDPEDKVDWQAVWIWTASDSARASETLLSTTITHPFWAYYRNGSWGSPSIRYLLHQSKASGFSRVYWRASLGGMALYPSKVQDFAPLKLANLGIEYESWNPLQEASSIAKDLGLEFIAWIPIMAENQGEGYLLGDFAESCSKLWENARDGGRWANRLDFSEPAVIEHKLEILREIVNYGVDGLLLDFFEVGCAGETMQDEQGYYLGGYNAKLQDLFRKKYQEDPQAISNSDPNWLAWRSQVITDFLKRLRQEFDVPIIALVPIEPYKAWALDIETWQQEGLIQHIIFRSSQREEFLPRGPENSTMGLAVDLDPSWSSLQFEKVVFEARSQKVDEIVLMEPLFFDYERGNFWPGIANVQLARQVFFRKQLEIPIKVTKAWASITGVNKFRLYINGNMVASGGYTDHYQGLDTYIITDEFNVGNNLIAIQVESDYGYAGLLLEGVIQFEDGSKLRLKTDSTWQVSTKFIPNWESSEQPSGVWWDAEKIAEPMFWPFKKNRVELGESVRSIINYRNRALKANGGSIKASSASSDAEKLIDGDYKNSSNWQVSDSLPQWIEVQMKEVYPISSIKLFPGYLSWGWKCSPGEIQLQYWHEGSWFDLLTSIQIEDPQGNNSAVGVTIAFPKINTDRIRIVITDCQDYMRERQKLVIIREIEVY